MAGRNPAQREQVGEQRYGRGQDSRGRGARQRGRRRRVPDQHHDPGRLTAIATGRYVGVTPESTVTQYPRPGIAYRPLRDAPPVLVRLVWWRDDAHPATTAATGCLPASSAAAERLPDQLACR
jgi:hypothetical protein